MSELIAVARTRWPEIPDDVKIRETTARTVCFPIAGDEIRAIGDRDWTWDFAKADMTLHPECYTLERKLEIMRHTTPRFGWLEVELEPVGDMWMGYCSRVNVLCVKGGNRE